METQTKTAPGLKSVKKYANNEHEKNLNTQYQEQNELVKLKRSSVVQQLYKTCDKVELIAVNQEHPTSVMELYHVWTKEQPDTQVQAWVIYYHDRNNQPCAQTTIHLPLI